MEPVDALSIARWQFRVAWSLATDVHLARLTTELCLWQPDPSSWTVRRGSDGRWWPDWADTDPVDPAPPSVGWLTWHLAWWWTDALAVVRGSTPADRETVPWAGSAAAVVAQLHELAEAWTSAVGALDDERLHAPTSFPWPNARPLIYTISWANLELMKNVAEIGEVANMYHATQPSQGFGGRDDQRG